MQKQTHLKTNPASVFRRTFSDKSITVHEPEITVLGKHGDYHI